MKLTKELVLALGFTCVYTEESPDAENPQIAEYIFNENEEFHVLEYVDGSFTSFIGEYDENIDNMIIPDLEALINEIYILGSETGAKDIQEGMRNLLGIESV